MRILAIALAASCALLLSACPKQAVKPDVPRDVIVAPKILTVTKYVTVRVPDRLTSPLPIAEGPLSMCPDVAAARREALKRANADRAETGALSGTETKP